MALGNGSGGFSDGDLIFLSPRNKDKQKQKVAPHFSVGRKVGDKIVDDEKTVSSVSGDLIRLDIRERDFKGEISKEAVLYLRDKEAKETYRLGLLFGIAPRGLFNRLATLDATGDFTGLTIDYYESKKGYENYALKQRNERVEWKYEMDAIPKPVAIMHPTTGKLVKNDYTPINDFFEAELRAISAKLAGQKGEARQEKAPADKAAAPVDRLTQLAKAASVKAEPAKEDDSLPF